MTGCEAAARPILELSPPIIVHVQVYGFGLATMRSGGVRPEVNVRNQLHIGDEAGTQESNLSLKPRADAHKKDRCLPNIFLKSY